MPPRHDLTQTGEVLLGFGLQGLVCLAILVLVADFARRQPLPHLRWWSYAWLALLVYVGTAALSLASYGLLQLPPTDWRRIGLSLVSTIAGLLQPALIVLGAYEGVRRQPVAERRRHWLLLGVTLLAIVVVFATLPMPGAIRNIVRLGARYVLTGGACLWAARMLWRYRVEARSRGPTLLAISITAYGAAQLHTMYWSVALFATPPGARGPVLSTLPFYLGYFDVALDFFLGLGMLVWHLEDRQERVQQALDALARSQEGLRQAQRMEVVGRLAGGVAHDFNNLMTVMYGATIDLTAMHPEGSPGRERVQEIEDALTRATGLTSQLLAFSRKQVSRVAPVDCTALLQSSQRMLTRLLGSDVVIRSDLPSAALTVLADEAQLSQIVMNLAVNARLAMPRGGELQLRLRPQLVDPSRSEQLRIPTGRYAHLSMADTGIGMSEAVRAQAFDPFFTTRPVGEGTGLGLSTVYGIVTGAGGAISLESVEGQGSTVHIYWPVLPSEMPVTGSVPVGAVAGDGPPPVRHARILVAEDEPQIREVLKRLLLRHGHDVHLASDGAEALMTATSEGPFDLLITDVVMPGLDGGELIAAIRERLPQLPIIAISGFTGDLETRHIPSDIGWLQKPFTLTQLTAAVDGALALSAPR